MSIASAFRSLAELAAKKAPYDDALALAQRRAALPVAEGGLGLPAGNTAMERAAAMGAQIHPMRPALFIGPRKPLTTNPEEGLFYRYGNLPDEGFSRHVQHGYAEPGVSTMIPIEELGWPILSQARVNSYYIGGDSQVIGQRPLYVVKGKKITETGSDGEPLVKDAKIVREATPHEKYQLSKDIEDWDIYNGGDRIHGIHKEFNAEKPNYSSEYRSLPDGQIRSRFAAFDPFRRNESDLLASVAPYALPAAGAAGLVAMASPGKLQAGIAGPLAKTADLAALKIAQKADADTSAYAKMMDLKRDADARARTHVPRASMTPGAQAARAMAIEAMNPASWPLLWGSRELGYPQALDYSNPYYSYSGSRR